MKNVFLITILFVSQLTFAQDNELDITSRNSWLKAGLTLGVPVGDTGDVSTLSPGIDLRGQYLVNPNFGIGVASGYNHYLGKDGFDDFGVIPVAGFLRYYFTPDGLFFGSDIGYGVLTNVNDNEGGLYVNPQIGYHNRDWNFYGFYQNTFAEGDLKVQNVGVGVTYNIRFD